MRRAIPLRRQGWHELRAKCLEFVAHRPLSPQTQGFWKASRPTRPRPLEQKAAIFESD